MPNDVPSNVPPTAPLFLAAFSLLNADDEQAVSKTEKQMMHNF
ncbi:MAG: hypothetical protein V7782_01865 [Psychromonas sp.]